MVVLRKIGVLKSALFMALMGVIFGFIAGLFVGIASSIISAMFSTSSSGGLGINPVDMIPFLGMGWLSVIVFPIVYGIGGFISGVIFVPLSNLVLKIINGIDLDFGEETQVTNQESTQQYQNYQQSY